MVYVITAYCHDRECWCYKRVRVIGAFTSKSEAERFISENESKICFEYEVLSITETSLTKGE